MKRKFKVAPLSGSFMITSVVGFVASALFVYKLSISWGVTFMLFFAIMFAASIVSMHYHPVPEHKHRKKKVYE